MLNHKVDSDEAVWLTVPEVGLKAEYLGRLIKLRTVLAWRHLAISTCNVSYHNKVLCEFGSPQS